MTLPPRCPAALSFLVLAYTAVASTGCATLSLPGVPFTGALVEESPYETVDGEFTLEASVAEQSYHSVRRARSENAVVLEVEGASGRVLPLPADNKTVYVSDLLRQAGVQKKIGHIEATLYRHSADSIGGLPMLVKIAKDGETVRPESDYALQPGDRLRVQKATNPALKGLLSAVLGG